MINYMRLKEYTASVVCSAISNYVAKNIIQAEAA